MSYGFGKSVNLSFDEAVEKTKAALAAEGFGVLMELDFAAILKAKLGLDLPPYRLLGACNPPLAAQALKAEPDVGLLLPCNVVVRQEENGAVRVMVMDPQAVLGLVENPAIAPLGQQVREKLDRVISALA